MFRRRSRDRDPNASQPADVYLGLRNQLLDLDPATVGLAATDADDRVWGFLMEMSYPNGTATLVCLRDGTTSLYTSSGGGIVGGGGHTAVVEANARVLAAVSSHLDQLDATTDRSLPAAGRTVIRALTYEGPRAYEAAEEGLGNGRDPMSPVFYAAHDVITQLRLVDEQHR